MARQNGGAIIAEALAQHGVKFLFTLCGGHISPILVGAKRAGIRVVDVRHEVNAVFAADAVARLEDDDRESRLLQLVGRGRAGGACTDDDDVTGDLRQFQLLR